MCSSLTNFGGRNPDSSSALGPSIPESCNRHGAASLRLRTRDTSRTTAYLRLIGRHDGLSKDRIQRPQADGRAFWRDHIATLAERGVEKVFVVVNNHYEGHAPATLRTLADELAAVPGLDVMASPGWPNGQVTLF